LGALPAVLTALVLDGVDQTIFQASGHDRPVTGGYDKAMDVVSTAISPTRHAGSF
jgi:hypothetical protein